NNAERICHDSKTLYKETEAGTLHTQAEGTRHLGERLQHIHFWKSELQRHIEKLVAETDLLLQQKRRLLKSLDATEIPFAIATDNLTCRERRLGPDLVKDHVEEELLKEVELISSIQALLNRTLSQAVNQIKYRTVKPCLQMKSNGSQSCSWGLKDALQLEISSKRLPTVTV
ncbi:tektin-4, partial [Salmo salar]